MRKQSTYRLDRSLRAVPYILAFLISIQQLTVFSQTKNDRVFVKGNFYNMPLVDWIKELESKNNVRFIYVNEVVDGIFLNGILRDNIPLVDALEILLKDHPVSFAVPEPGEIVLFSNAKKVVSKTMALYTLTGTVTDQVTGLPLPYVSVVIPAADKATMSDENGDFVIKPLAPGTYLVQFTYVGYESIIRKVSVDGNARIDAGLRESAFQLKELVISPSLFEISTVEITPLTMGKTEILHSPNMAKDLYRTMKTLPGIANSDFSSKARIRGGHSDETAVYLDHFLINEAFHLEEVDGSFSMFNTDYIDELTVLTGGFSAKYTDRLSGIVDARTFDNMDADKYSISIDLMNLSVLAQKKITARTNVFVTARRGYLDFLLRKMGTDDNDVIDPRYMDLWAKVTHRVNERNSFSFNALVGRDNFALSDAGEDVSDLEVMNIRDNINSWANWKWFPAANFNSITTIGFQQLDRRADFGFQDNIDVDNVDSGVSQTWVLTNNSYWDLAKNKSVEFGFEARQFTTRYHYQEKRYDVYASTPDNIIIHDVNFRTHDNGFTGAAYAQFNWTLDKLVIQPAVRTSYQTFTSSANVAPRVALSYNFLSHFTLKAAYGVYYQSDLYFKMRTSLFQKRPYDYNSQATQYTGSLTFSKERTMVMLNLYHKEYDRLFDDYRFEFFNRIGGVSILDVPFGTRSGYARGFEIMVRQNYGHGSMVTLSYARSQSMIRNGAGTEVPRDFDQPHSIVLNNTFRLNRDWTMSLLWTFHTGFPYTPTKPGFIQYRPDTEQIVLFYEAGEKNSQRLPNYHSLDLRVEKLWHLGKNNLSVYLNIVNFYGRNNLRSHWWLPLKRPDGTVFFSHEKLTNIPFFVSPGISFTLY